MVNYFKEIIVSSIVKIINDLVNKNLEELTNQNFVLKN